MLVEMNGLQRCWVTGKLCCRDVGSQGCIAEMLGHWDVVLQSCWVTEKEEKRKNVYIN